MERYSIEREGWNVRVMFDDVGSIVDEVVAGKPRNPGNARRYERFMAEHEGTPWFGGARRSGASSIVSSPDPRVMEAVDAAKRAIEDEVVPPTRRRRKMRRNREDGDEIDPDAVLSRRTDGWTRMERTRRPTHVVSVAVNTCIADGTDPRVLVNRGAMAAAIADLLTDVGCSVEVVSVVGSFGTSPEVGVTSLGVTVKRPEDPMDLGAVATGCADLRFFRLLGLGALILTCPGVVRPHLGSPRRMDTEDRSRYNIVVDANVSTPGQAAAVVRAAMREYAGQGVGS